MAYEWVKHYDVRVLANYGLQGRMLGLNGVQTYPSLPGDEHGNRTAELIFSQWNPDLFITLYDIWMGAYTRNTGQGFEPIHRHWIPLIMCVSGDTQILGNETEVLGFDNGLNYSGVKSIQSFRPFSSVYEIETFEKRKLQITAENPIWTSHGWKLAKDLNKGDLVSILNKDDILERNGLGISSWINRWRRNRIYQKLSTNSSGKQNETRTSHNNSQQFTVNNGLSHQHLQNQLQNSETPNKRECKNEASFLSMDDRWLSTREGITRKSVAISDNKEATCRNSSTIHSMENKPDKRIQSEKRSNRHRIDANDKTSEFLTWERVARKHDVTRRVKRVYDLTTATHNFFANGFLIHNCDHEPIPEGTAMQCVNAFKCVVPLKYGIEQLARYGIEAEHIPLGIDTNVFKPSTDKKADKVWLSKRACPVNNQRQLPLDEDCFLILMNGANKDPYRKGFMRMFTALQMFLDQNPEARQKTRVYIHSWMRQARDLPHGAKVLGVDQFMKCTNDYHNLCGVPEDALARFYGAADVFFHLSEGGGFEIPVLEAMSAGVPVITTDFLCMKELVEDRGWLIPPIREGKAVSKYFTPLDATQCIANEEKAADALEDAWLHPEKRAKYAELGRQHALNFDWGLVNQKWIGLFEEIRASWRQKPLSERKL